MKTTSGNSYTHYIIWKEGSEPYYKAIGYRSRRAALEAIFDRRAFGKIVTIKKWTSIKETFRA